MHHKWIGGYIMHYPVFERDRQRYLPSTEIDKCPENFLKLLKSDKISSPKYSFPY